MMMRQIVPYLLAALVCAAFAPTSYASGVADSKELTNLISQSCDARMTTNDLAFFLATHNYYAVPRGDHVDLKLNGKVYKLVPNGDAPGLCNIES